MRRHRWPGFLFSERDLRPPLSYSFSWAFIARVVGARALGVLGLYLVGVSQEKGCVSLWRQTGQEARSVFESEPLRRAVAQTEVSAGKSCGMRKKQAQNLTGKSLSEL